MQPESFVTFFKLKNGPFLLKGLGAALLVLSIGLYKAYSNDSLTDGQLIGIIVGTVLAIDLVFFLMFLLPYLSYKKFLLTDSSLVDDWKTFIMRRSKHFLTGHRYVKVSFSLMPTPNSTQQHREVIAQFLMRWQTESESLHKGTWKKGSPDKFRVQQNSIAGHVGIGGGMSLLLRKLFSEFPSLSKRVQGQVQASLQFGNEANFEEDLTPSASDEAYERELDRKWRDS